MRLHPFDILGIVPSLDCTKEDVSRARRAAGLMLKQNGGQHCTGRDGVEYIYTLSEVNDSADSLVKVIEEGGLLFYLCEYGKYTSN